MRRRLVGLRFALLLVLLALSGCATTEVSNYIPPLDRASLMPLRTDDPAVIQQRFGNLGVAAGHAFGYRGSRVVSVVFYEWDIEGALLKERTLKCANYLIGDASCDEWTHLIYYNQGLRALVFQDQKAYATGRLQPDGSLVVDRPGYANYTESFNPATGELKIGAAIIGDSVFKSLNPQELAAMREEQKNFLANLGRKNAESSAFWANVSQAVLTGAQTYAAERQQQIAQDQQRQYEADLRTAQASEQARAQAERARQIAARRAEQARLHAQRSEQAKAQAEHRAEQARLQAEHRAEQARQQRAAAAKPLPARTQVAVANRVQEPALVTPMSRPASPAAQPDVVAKTNQPELFAYPEAVIVCTIPDGKGRFKCDDPLHQGEGGGPNGMEQDRTPEAKVASIKADVCKGAHRLRSSTHLVWGCGFAATGVSPYLDRAGPGVDVRGRRTYYCPRDYPFTCTKTSR